MCQLESLLEQPHGDAAPKSPPYIEVTRFVGRHSRKYIRIKSNFTDYRDILLTNVDTFLPGSYLVSELQALQQRGEYLGGPQRVYGS